MRLALFGAVYAGHPDGFFQRDSVGYWQLAENLKERGVFSQRDASPYTPAHWRTPLYPLFLAGAQGAGLGPTGAVLLQILLGAALCVVVVRLARELTGRWDAALVAGAFAALDVPSISLATSLLAETLFTALLVGSGPGPGPRLARRRCRLAAGLWRLAGTGRSCAARWRCSCPRSGPACWCSCSRSRRRGGCAAPRCCCWPAPLS